MADIELVIKIPEEYYKSIKEIPVEQSTADMLIIKNGTILPKGHGRLIDADVLVDGMEDNYEFCEEINATPTIIKANKEYEAEVITRGNCMMCGKELTEGLFFCNECEDKANRSR